MADCSTCEKKKAKAAPDVELSDDEKKIIFVLEGNNAKHQSFVMKLVAFMFAIFAAAMVVAFVLFNRHLVEMNKQFVDAWKEYDYESEEVAIDGGLDGIANYIGGGGTIVNGENNSTQTGETP